MRRPPVRWPTAERRSRRSSARWAAARRRRCATCAGSRVAPRGSPARSSSRSPAARAAPLILQMDRGRAAPRPAGRGWRRPCSGPPARPASRCPASWRWATERRPRRRLAGGRAPRGRDDPAQDPARRRVGRRPAAPSPPRRAGPWPPSTPSTPGADRRAAAGRPAAATRSPSSMRWARCARRSSSACAGWPRTARRTARRVTCTVTSGWATSWSVPTGCAACSTGSWRTPATRPRTSAGCAPRPGASAGPARWAASARSTSCSPPTRRRAARPIDPGRVHWWQVYATVKWATICALQASAHLSGADPLGRAGRHRPPGLRERVGSLRPAGHAAARDRRAPIRRTAPRRRPVRPADRGRARRGRARVPRRRHGAAARAAPASRPGWRATRWAIAERELRLGPALAAAHAAAPGRARLRRRRRAGRGAPVGRARRRLGQRWRRRSPRRPATSCWWRTPPTCRRRPGRAAGTPASGRVSAGAGRAARPRRRRRPSRAPRLPMPCRTRPASQAAADHEDPGVVEGVHGADAPVAVPRMATRHGHPEGDADLAASWRRARSRWRSARAAAVPWRRRRARAA